MITKEKKNGMINNNTSSVYLYILTSKKTTPRGQSSDILYIFSNNKKK